MTSTLAVLLMIKRFLLIVAFVWASALGLSTCLAQTQAELSQETARFARPGMRFAEAVANLEAAGYRCGKSQLAMDDPKAASCSRQHSYRVLATCIQTVLLWPESDGSHVERLDIRAPVCAGL
jgi:hypothetical protein